MTGANGESPKKIGVPSELRFPRVAIESPLKAETEEQYVRNLNLARRACRHAFEEGLNPFASHLLMTQFLDDSEPSEREAGIFLGLSWTQGCFAAWFVLRESEELSEGMEMAMGFHYNNRTPIRRFRTMNNGRSLAEVNQF